MLGNPHSFGTGPLRITETVPGGRSVRFSVAGVRGRQRRAVAYPIPALRRGRYTVGPTTVKFSVCAGASLARMSNQAPDATVTTTGPVAQLTVSSLKR